MRFALSALVILGTVAGLSADDKPVFRAGAFAMDVTPLQFPVSVNGGFTDQQATKANDPLHARCLVLDDAKTKLAIVVVDNCLIPRELMESAKALAEKATKIPTGNMLISATHTHMAPTVIATFGSPANVDYVEFLTQKIADGIAKARGRPMAPRRLEQTGAS